MVVAMTVAMTDEGHHGHGDVYGNGHGHGRGHRHDLWTRQASDRAKLVATGSVQCEKNVPFVAGCARERPSPPHVNVDVGASGGDSSRVRKKRSFPFLFTSLGEYNIDMRG